MLPEALPTPRDPLPDDRRPRRASFMDDDRPLPEPVPGSDFDAFAVEWQLVASGNPDR
jgi:hypothetical protein